MFLLYVSLSQFSASECAFVCFQNFCTTALLEEYPPSSDPSSSNRARFRCLLAEERSEICTGDLQRHSWFPNINRTFLSCIQCSPKRPTTVSHLAFLEESGRITTPLPLPIAPAASNRNNTSLLPQILPAPLFSPSEQQPSLASSNSSLVTVGLPALAIVQPQPTTKLLLPEIPTTTPLASIPTLPPSLALSNRVAKTAVKDGGDDRLIARIEALNSIVESLNNRIASLNQTFSTLQHQHQQLEQQYEHEASKGARSKSNLLEEPHVDLVKKAITDKRIDGTQKEGEELLRGDTREKANETTSTTNSHTKNEFIHENSVLTPTVEQNARKIAESSNKEELNEGKAKEKTNTTSKLTETAGERIDTTTGQSVFVAERETNKERSSKIVEDKTKTAATEELQAITTITPSRNSLELFNKTTDEGIKLTDKENGSRTDAISDHVTADSLSKNSTGSEIRSPVRENDGKAKNLANGTVDEQQLKSGDIKLNKDTEETRTKDGKLTTKRVRANEVSFAEIAATDENENVTETSSLEASTTPNLNEDALNALGNTTNFDANLPNKEDKNNSINYKELRNQTMSLLKTLDDLNTHLNVTIENKTKTTANEKPEAHEEEGGDLNLTLPAPILRELVGQIQRLAQIEHLQLNTANSQQRHFIAQQHAKTITSNRALSIRPNEFENGNNSLPLIGNEDHNQLAQQTVDGNSEQYSSSAQRSALKALDVVNNSITAIEEQLSNFDCTFQAETIDKRPSEFITPFEFPEKAQTAEQCAARCYRDGCTSALFDLNNGICNLGYGEDNFCNDAPTFKKLPQTAFAQPAKHTNSKVARESAGVYWIHCIECATDRQHRRLRFHA